MDTDKLLFDFCNPWVVAGIGVFLMFGYAAVILLAWDRLRLGFSKEEKLIARSCWDPSLATLPQQDKAIVSAEQQEMLRTSSLAKKLVKVCTLSRMVFWAAAFGFYSMMADFLEPANIYLWRDRPAYFNAVSGNEHTGAISLKYATMARTFARGTVHEVSLVRLAPHLVDLGCMRLALLITDQSQKSHMSYRLRLCDQAELDQLVAAGRHVAKISNAPFTIYKNWDKKVKLAQAQSISLADLAYSK